MTGEGPATEGQGDAVTRVQVLRKQADWCVDMATKALTPKMFQKYVELATAYQRQAADIERRLGLWVG